MSAVTQPTYEWKTLPWKKIQRGVFKLQKRIYQAKQRGDRATVHKLQRLLTHSWQARCLAVKRVAQENQGKNTAGVDGVRKLGPQQRLALVSDLQRPTKPKPVRRVYIAKPGKVEKRPLGIPVMRDRAHQALVKMALEPEWEARFEPNSFGFRPGRCCQDAIEAIFNAIKYVPRYALDADIKGCFDNINQEHLLQKLDTYPALCRVIQQWLKAGVMEEMNLIPTEKGTPQGGVISPLLANIALHGLEERITQAFPQKVVGKEKTEWSYRPKVIRYADDFVILHQDLQVIKQCQVIAQQWLAEIGLELQEAKTRITHTLHRYGDQTGFDFLGFNVRQFPVGKTHHRKTGIVRQGTNLRINFKTIIRPSQAAIKRHYRAIAETIARYNARGQAELIVKLNPQIRGWCRYYATVVAKKVFSKLDHLVCQRLLRWGRRRHRKQSRKRMVAKYFNINRDRGTHRPWDFIAPNGAALLRYADTGIQRHVMVKRTRSPFDGDFVYWAMRMGKHPLLPKQMARLLKRQGGKCVECGLYFWEAEKIGMDYIIPKQAGGKDAYWNWFLLHTHCHEQKQEPVSSCLASSPDSGLCD